MGVWDHIGPHELSIYWLTVIAQYFVYQLQFYNNVLCLAGNFIITFHSVSIMASAVKGYFS